MINVPAHKQTDPAKKPGQIENDVTLNDYIKRKLSTEPARMTFKDWWLSVYKQMPGDGWSIDDIAQRDLYNRMLQCWETAQRNA